MTRKIFGPKSITHLIYGLLMMLPFLAIGVKCAYVSANKNAKDSYSQITQNIITPVTSLTYQDSVLYNFKYVNPSTENSSVVPFTYLSLSASDLGISQVTRDTLVEWSLRSNNTIWFGNGTSHNLVSRSLTLPIFSNFNFIASRLPQSFSVFNITYSQIVEGKLDNVFDYSISQVIDENNGFVPKNDFVSLLNGVFSTNSNHLYLRFTNWYLNYALLISTIYILFLAMLWFVNLCRNILERSMNIGNGVDD